MNENKIQILFKDTEDWLSLTGVVTLWTDFGSRTAPGRVYSKWQQPTRLVDNWNGKQEPILDTRYNAYYVEFNIRESELELLSKMQSCTVISIIDITAGLTYSADLSDLTLFEVSDPVQVESTTNYTVNITFRTDKTYITYANRPGTEYSVIAYNANADGTFKAIDTEFTTALDGAKSLVFPLRYKPLYTETDPEISAINNNDGINSASKILSKRAVNILQFDTETNANYFKKYCTLCNTVGLNHNTDLRSSSGKITNDLLTNTVTLLLPDFIIPGMILEIATETVTINEVFDTYFTTTPNLTGSYVAYSYKLSYFERFLETPQITSNLFAENLYKNVLAANINVLNWYPNA